jgi:hypothetical protein
MGESASSSSAWWKRGGIHSTVTPQGTRKVELAVILVFFFGGVLSIYIYIYYNCTCSELFLAFQLIVNKHGCPDLLVF